MKINQLDLFSGIGGFHLGFERAGYKVTSYFSEIDQHAIAVYKHQFPNSTYVGSVTNVRGADLPRIDLITFGSPCQDFSLAGKRAGMEGERSSLVLQAIRLISECRPSVFVWENVKGTFSSNDGADFWAIIQAFANIGGYRLEWQLLNTSWFLPQNRERIYLVGYSTTTGGDWRGIFPIRQRSRENFNKARSESDTSLTILKRYWGAKSQGTYIGSGDKVRTMTEIECERLQGFPDNWTSCISKPHRYETLGNAVSVDVVAAVAKNCLPLFKTNQQ
jgi:DNA (cytosine-5)-methyltransferase 1